MTLNPYLGCDPIQPFLDHAGKDVIPLQRISHLGGEDFQARLWRPATLSSCGRSHCTRLEHAWQWRVGCRHYLIRGNASRALGSDMPL
jgi:hypothetical protein